MFEEQYRHIIINHCRRLFAKIFLIFIVTAAAAATAAVLIRHCYETRARGCSSRMHRILERAAEEELKVITLKGIRLNPVPRRYVFTTGESIFAGDP